MISRRLVRIKAMQAYYAFLQDDDETSIPKIWNELEHSIYKSYHLYVSLHCLLIAISDFAKDRIEIKKKKLIPTQQDLNPNTKFVDNKIIEAFTNNPTISDYMSNNEYNWTEYPEFIKNLWTTISNSEKYNTYIKENRSIKSDYEIIEYIIKKVLIENKDLEEIIEEKSIYWNDDLEFALSNILQHSRKIKEHKTTYNLEHVFKNEDDEEFAKNLIKKAALNKEKFDNIIIDTLQKWELERIAFLDRVILHLAICEFMQMPEIPVKVTINEYLDISHCYSTPKSSLFINGILDKIYTKLKKENKLNKSGLGLVENI